MKFVFYSYKGGVGRTFIMAHMAIGVAASRKNLKYKGLAKDRDYKILTIDMDLEAPGLHRYLQQSEGSEPGDF